MDITYYLTYDLPIPYKNILIYPVTVRNYLLFGVFSQCLTIEKNHIPDIKIISMSDLEYLFHQTEDNPEEKPYLFWLDRLFSYSFKDEKSFEKIEESIMRYKYDERGKPYFEIREEKYDSQDYTKLKEIIAEQNMVELVDENISKEVRDSLQKARDYKNKLAGGGKTAPFEDYVVALSISTGWTYEYIYDLPIKKFIKSIRRMDNFIHYKIYLSASMSGMVEFKDKSFIKHWLTNLDEKDKYSDVSMDLDTMKNKVSLESAKNGTIK